MVNLSPIICERLKNARRAAKLSQSAVAAEVGCLQSALSMFEQGDGTKLNDEVIERLAAKFGVSLTATPVPMAAETSLSTPAGSGFCPNPKCPSNVSYTVDGLPYLRPNLEEADPVGGRFCAVCGEVLEKRCPHCGAPVHAGAVCSLCGERYIVV